MILRRTHRDCWIYIEILKPYNDGFFSVMNILYIASILPNCLLMEITQKGIGYVVAPQKFHHSLLSGLNANGHHVKVITQTPVGVTHKPYIKEDGIDYYFCCQSSHSVLKPVSVVKDVKRIFKQGIDDGFKPDAIICDSLNVSYCLSALYIRKAFKVQVTAIVTDIMGISAHESHSLTNRLASWVSNWYLAYFDKYVFLTEQMNTYLNKKKRPYIVMEGVCPPQDAALEVTREENDITKRVFYAGGRPSKDGVDLLVSAFKQIHGDYLLDIYGPMPGIKKGKDEEDERITYYGTVSNEEIVRGEFASTLLVNPRPIDEEYTKYSFPSKLMEYMNTGTALVTTRLPGIPKEYYDYVYTFDEVSVEAYKDTLTKILVTDPRELKQKGFSAREYVRKNKNSIVQTARIIKLLES